MILICKVNPFVLQQIDFQIVSFFITKFFRQNKGNKHRLMRRMAFNLDAKEMSTITLTGNNAQMKITIRLNSTAFLL